MSTAGGWHSPPTPPPPRIESNSHPPTQAYLRMMDLVKVAETMSASGVISHKTLKASRSSPPLKGDWGVEG